MASDAKRSFVALPEGVFGHAVMPAHFLDRVVSVPQMVPDHIDRYLLGERSFDAVINRAGRQRFLWGASPG